ncbi:hypothetical protein [Frankia sp. CgS1]|nr:hypothetical protein [Frankia sp. CgIS1]OHV56978.1 hypothetical protein CgIS1_07975 [Frankia sp. CgIS1]
MPIVSMSVERRRRKTEAARFGWPDREWATMSWACRFVHRMQADQVFQFGHELVVPPERQVGLDPELGRVQPGLLQRHDVRCAEAATFDIREGRAAPLAQRLAQQPARRLGIAPSRGSPPGPI